MKKSYLLQQTSDGNKIYQYQEKDSPNSKDLENPKWWKKNKEDVLNSWSNQFHFQEEMSNECGEITQKGLRTPQQGAIYATLAHWTTTSDRAIIVMPTGTGKTETMLSLLIKQQIRKLLVIVPSDSLRKQIGDKFISLGELKFCGIIGEKVKNPIVSRIYHQISSIEEVDLLWERCHVIVTTIGSINACSETVRQRLAGFADYVFVDEAHHSVAPTWQKFLNLCNQGRIVLFTATPYREDGKKLQGKLVYTYPLSLAQKEGYFRYIDLWPISQYDYELVDRDLATKAVEILERDLKNGLDHILMARVESILRAEEVFSIYEQYTDYKPVLIHSELSKADADSRIKSLLSRESRIAVCVNMLGEGFDLPNLKVAALHDNHKSWAVFLQFIGRFVRNKPELGDASVIFNEVSRKVGHEMKSLYEPDSDWNSIIRVQSQNRIQSEIDKQECFEGFANVPFSFSIEQISPKTSVVVYQLPVTQEWKPENCFEGFKSNVEVQYALNIERDVLLICAKHVEKPDWADSETIHDIEHALYAIYYDSEYRLMFLHSSNTDSYHEKIAEAIGGKDLLIINNDKVFRCFEGLYELRLFNVGLSETMGTQIRYTMHVGPNVKEGLTEILTTNKSKANLFGAGIKDGKPFTIGGSYKGRIWSRFQYDLQEFKEWCIWVKSKITDDSIDTGKILNNVWMPETLNRLPGLIPTYIDWPEEFYKHLSKNQNFFLINDKPYDWCEAGIRLRNVSEEELLFIISVEENYSIYSFSISENGFSYSLREGDEIWIKAGRNHITLPAYFQTNPPRIRYADLSYSMNDVRYCPPPNHKINQFNLDHIYTWDWTGTDIKKESQKLEKRPDSIQRRVIEELLKDPAYCIIYDDDNSGEIADVVAIKEEEKHIAVELYHLKFSKSSVKGHRIDDLYTVCGQAQCSGIWQNPKMDIITQLRNREIKRLKTSSISRFERGDMNTTLYKLQNLQKQKPFRYSVFAIQPGLSKVEVTSEQLLVLGTTETYLMYAYKIPFRLIASS